PVGQQRIGGFGKEERRLAFGVMAPFPRMFGIVATHAIDAAHRKARLAAADRKRRLRLGGKDILRHRVCGPYAVRNPSSVSATAAGVKRERPAPRRQVFTIGGERRIGAPCWNSRSNLS